MPKKIFFSDVHIGVGNNIDVIDSHPDEELIYAYANCGAWTKDKNKTTYIETEKDDTTHTVRFMKWRKTKNPNNYLLPAYSQDNLSN